MALIIGEKETRRLINMDEALKVVETIFHDRAAGKTGSLARRRLKGSQRQLNMMAAWQQESDLICLRAYAGGANTITLYSGRTGRIEAILNAAYLSSLRTGAASGVAAKYLAPPKAETLGLIGPGWQATFQVEAIMRSFPARQIFLFGRDPKKTRTFIRKMSRNLKAEWRECSSLEETESLSDILVLATDSTSPIIRGSRLKEEVLVVTMGANQPVKHEVSAELIQRMDLIVTDDLPTARNDSGDLIAACQAGILRWEDVIPLERIVAQGAPRPRPKRILFQSNGIADEDLAVGRYVLERARRKKLRAKKLLEI